MDSSKSFLWNFSKVLAIFLFFTITCQEIGAQTVENDDGSKYNTEYPIIVDPVKGPSEDDSSEEFSRSGPICSAVHDSESTFSRKAVGSKYYWTGAIIPYIIDETVIPHKRKNLVKCVADFEEHTCLKFIDQTDNPNFDSKVENSVYITDDRHGCFAALGQTGFPLQVLNLGNRCGGLRVITHELGHAIGLRHEHAKTGRDKYVKILDENLDPEIATFDEKYTLDFDIPYDYRSIMHYEANSFASDLNKNTILTKDPRHQYRIGTYQVLSYYDAKIIFKMYCQDVQAERCNLTTSDICNDGYLLPNCKCRCPFGVSGNNCQIGVAVEPDTVCGGNITKEGVYQTPNYPKRSFNKLQRSCVWWIQAPQSMNVSIYFEDFSYESTYNLEKGIFNCHKQKIEVRLNGLETEGDYYCDEALLNKTVQSNGNEALILIDAYHFRTDKRGMRFWVSFVGSSDSTITSTPTDSTRTCAPAPEPILCGVYNVVRQLDTYESIEASSDDSGAAAFQIFRTCVELTTVNKTDRIKVDFEKFIFNTETNCQDNCITIIGWNPTKKMLLNSCVSNSYFNIPEVIKLRLRYKIPDPNCVKFKIKFTAVPKSA